MQGLFFVSNGCAFLLEAKHFLFCRVSSLVWLGVFFFALLHASLLSLTPTQRNPNLCWDKQAGSSVLCPDHSKRQQQLSAEQGEFFTLLRGKHQPALWGCWDLYPRSQDRLNGGRPTWGLEYGPTAMSRLHPLSAHVAAPLGPTRPHSSLACP